MAFGVEIRPKKTDKNGEKSYFPRETHVGECSYSI